MELNCDSTNSGILGGRQRKVEVGQFSKIKEVSVIFYYESFPTWILLVDVLQSCSTLTVYGVGSMTAFEDDCLAKSDCSVEFLRWVVKLVGESKFRFQPDTSHKSNDCLLLLSGSLKFVAEYIVDIFSPVLFVVDEHFLGRLRNGKPSGIRLMSHVNWFRYDHQSVGGSHVV